MLNLPAISAPEELHASFRCDLAEVRPMAQRIRDFLCEKGVAENDLMSCELALVEACNNAVLYAPEAASLQPIEVQVSCSDTQIVLFIHDHTAGFEIPEANRLPQNDNESGRGLFIMRSIMDEVTYQNHVYGNTMRMVKYRNDFAPPPRPESRQKRSPTTVKG